MRAAAAAIGQRGKDARSLRHVSVIVMAQRGEAFSDRAAVGIVAGDWGSRKRDDTSDFYVAPQQEASHSSRRFTLNQAPLVALGTKYHSAPLLQGAELDWGLPC
jgi:hypothetical protein